MENNPNNSSEKDITNNKVQSSKFSKIRLALLYILIGGLVVSALISVAAILIGEFNSSIIKALATTFVFVAHSLVVIGIVSADSRNQIGKSLVSSTMLAATIANLFTMTLGIWDLWWDGSSWKAFLIYNLIIGSAFLIAGTLKLRLKHLATSITAWTTTALIINLALLLGPWIAAPDASWISDFYFRLIGAIAILASTSLILLVIFNRIALSQKPELSQTRPAVSKLSTGLLAINIVVGILVAIFWVYGLAYFLVKATNYNETPYQYEDSYYDDSYYR